MHPQFQVLTPRWFLRAYVYTGSIGEFRYRFQHNNGDTIHAAVYSRVCFELATDITERDFPWTDEGVDALRHWLQERYEAFVSSQG